MITRKDRERAYRVQMAALDAERSVCRLSWAETMQRMREIREACFGKPAERQ